MWKERSQGPSAFRIKCLEMHVRLAADRGGEENDSDDNPLETA
jgi:hypothetical protein